MQCTWVIYGHISGICLYVRNLLACHDMVIFKTFFTLFQFSKSFLSSCCRMEFYRTLEFCSNWCDELNNYEHSFLITDVNPKYVEG